MDTPAPMPVATLDTLRPELEEMRAERDASRLEAAALRTEAAQLRERLTVEVAQLRELVAEVRDDRDAWRTQAMAHHPGLLERIWLSLRPMRTGA